MDEHDELRRQLTPLVEQPEPSTEGDWYCVSTRDLLQWQYVEFHFDYETGKLNMARLSNDD